jgi:HopA1 effector protein family
MEPELKSELEGIIGAVEFLSDEAFTFAGKQSAPMPMLPPGAPAQSADLPPLLAQLQKFLYNYCYVRRFDGVAPDPKPMENPVDAELVEQLSRANTSKNIRDEGWTIYDFLTSGQVLVQKQQLFRAVWPGEFLTLDLYAKAPQPGASVAIFLPRESRNVQLGFYFALGETVADQQDEYSLVRFYWNLDHTAAPALVRALTGELNRFQVPFRFKCPNHRAAYERTDCSVLYVSKRFFRIAAELVGRVTGTLTDRLRKDTPLFTRRLSNGLAFAEDTGSQESFGMSRCRMLAQGLWNAHQKGAASVSARLVQVEEEFERNRVNLDCPYMNPGSVDGYQFPEIVRAEAV